MKITELKTHRMQFEENSQDRRLNVATYANFNLIDAIPDDKISWDMGTNQLTGSITINGNEITSKPNYLSFKAENIFNSNDDDQLTYYYFILGASANHGNGSYTYNVKMDVIAMFGEGFFDFLQGKRIMVDRMHQDRYIYSFNDQAYRANADYRGLINADFNANNTVGETITSEAVRLGDYDDDDHYTWGYENVSRLFYANFNEVSGLAFEGEPSLYKDNELMCYAIIATSGEPLLNNSQGSFYGVQDNYVVVPVFTKSEDNLLYTENSMGKLATLQAGKIISIFLSTWKPSLADRQSLRKGGDDFIGFIVNVRENIFENTDYTTFANLTRKNISDMQILIEPSEMSTIIRENDIKTMEIAKSHQNITKNTIDFILSPNQQFTIDMHNWVKDQTFKIKSFVDIGGSSTSILFNGNKEVIFDSQMQISNISNAGATYLAQNGSQIENAKWIADSNVKSEQWRAGTSFFSIKGGFNNVMGSGGGIVDSIQAMHTAEYEQKNVQAKINDAKATAPAVSQGGNITSLLTRQVNSNTLSFNTYTPNDYIINKIINYHNKFGVNYSDWVEFDPDMINSRENFTYFKVENVIDYFNNDGIATEFDIDILNEINRLLSIGLRFWIRNISYGERNFERNIISSSAAIEALGEDEKLEEGWDNE